jgi:hypothetical protein
MNLTRKTTSIASNILAGPSQQVGSKAGKRKIMAAGLVRGAGLAATGAGILFIGVQAIHPLDVLSSVTTGQWAIVHYLSVVMDLLGLVGIAGLYARQVEKAGWLGLAGAVLFGLFWAITTAFHFIEALILPVLATTAPTFVESWLGIVGGQAGEMDLGLLPAVYSVNGLFYLFGGLLFAIATIRARVLPRWAAVLLAIGIVLPILGSSLVPHPYDRVFAVPVGLALAWLGYAVWSEKKVF